LLLKACEAIKAQNIDVVMSKRKNSFENPFMFWILSVLKLANKRNDSGFLHETVNSFRFSTSISVSVEELIALSDSSDGDYLKGFYSSLEQSNIERDSLNTLLYDLVE